MTPRVAKQCRVAFLFLELAFAPLIKFCELRRLFLGKTLLGECYQYLECGLTITKMA